MTIFSGKKKRSALGKKLDKPLKKEELPELQDVDYGLGDEFLGSSGHDSGRNRESLGVAPQQSRPPVQPQQVLAPQSFNSNREEMMLNKLDVIDVKLDGLMKRIEALEHMVQNLHQPPQSQPQSSYKAYQRRIW